MRGLKIESRYGVWVEEGNFARSRAVVVETSITIVSSDSKTSQLQVAGEEVVILMHV